MVALRFAVVLGLVSVAACHRAGTQTVVGVDAAVEPQAEDITIQTHGYDKCGRINR